MSDAHVRIILLFADEGSFHRETISLPADALQRHERLIDCLREDPAVLERTYVDVGRLVSAQVEGSDGAD